MDEGVAILGLTRLWFIWIGLWVFFTQRKLFAKVPSYRIPNGLQANVTTTSVWNWGTVKSSRNADWHAQDDTDISGEQLLLKMKLKDHSSRPKHWRTAGMMHVESSLKKSLFSQGDEWWKFIFSRVSLLPDPYCHFFLFSNHTNEASRFFSSLPSFILLETSGRQFGFIKNWKRQIN